MTADIVERLNSREHYDCDDGYYSCPQAEGYFGEYEGTDRCFCDVPLFKEAADEIERLRAAVLRGHWDAAPEPYETVNAYGEAVTECMHCAEPWPCWAAGGVES